MREEWHRAHMESIINFKNRTDGKQSLASFFSSESRPVEDQPVGQDCSNQTLRWAHSPYSFILKRLSWVLKNATPERKYDIAQMEHSLVMYTAEFAEFSISTKMHSMLQRACQDAQKSFGNAGIKLTITESLEILYITMTVPTAFYTVLNGVVLAN